MPALICLLRKPHASEPVKGLIPCRRHQQIQSFSKGKT